jgi:UDP-2-acetamido-2-deoxy-ribo-hexuluronate aminotransferase
MAQITVPFFTNKYQDERYGNQIREKIDEIIKKGIFISGEEGKIFEQRIASYCGCKHAVGVANGSDALFIAQKAMHLPEESEVITTPFTFFASTSCIVRNNLRPVFVDISEKTYNINVNLIEEKITKKTSGILPVDLFSQTANITKLNSIAKKHNLKILEDSAEAFGMKWKGKHAGTETEAGVLSFFPTKTLSCFGDGGMIITNNDELAAECKIMRVHGAAKKYMHKIVGINSRLDEIQAGILSIKLDHVDEEITERSKIANKYYELLKDVPQIKLPYTEKEATPVWYVFSMQCEKRDYLQAFLHENGIGTSIYYPIPAHLQECFKYLGYKKGDFPVAEKLCEKALALPIFIGMNDNLIEYVCENIKKFYK